MKTLQLQKRVACFAMAIGTTLACSAVMAQVEPRNPDRGVWPVISGSMITIYSESSYKQCTVGAVLVPRNPFYRLLPYQSATRWLVTAKHCSLGVSSNVVAGRTPIGTVVWESPTSDLALVKVPPVINPQYVYCQAHHSGSFYCNPFAQYNPRAYNQVFMPRGGREARLAVTGWSNAPDETFCTSGWRTGVRCVWRGMSLEPGMRRPDYAHISAAHGSEYDSLNNGDSGGPVVTYDRHLIGIISTTDDETTSMLFYTPMEHVLEELNSYTLAATNAATAAGEDNPLSPFGGENPGWELAPDDADEHAGAGQTQPIGG